MGQGLHKVLVVTAAVAGLVGITPIAHAGIADGTHASMSTVFDGLPAELANCVFGELSGNDRRAVSVVCRRLHDTLPVVHTQQALDTALTSPTAAHILVVSHENMSIATVPANSQSAIAVYDTRPAGSRKRVSVTAPIHVTASGTARVWAYGSSKVTASGTAHVDAYDSSEVTASGTAHVDAYDSSEVTASGTAHVHAYDSSEVTASSTAHVWASGSSQVTASGTAHVHAFGSSQVTASDQATVLVGGGKQPGATVIGHGSAVRIWTTPTSGAVIQLDDALRGKTITQQEMNNLLDNGVAGDIW
ncbi:MAG: hypothetical protein H0T78_01970 [Longispora sp.]|nr:hypothetical protein [Longispora sp. (in: high G+C Gram-positive bacteria)]